jgi:rhodanese-related sulfurtransferase
MHLTARSGTLVAMNVDRMLADARDAIDRVDPQDLAAEHAAGALVIDIRPSEQRLRDGELVGAVVVDRNVLEWRLDVTSTWKLDRITSPDQRIVLVCHQGYASSLAAATLRELGMTQVADLAGGVEALLAAGVDPLTALR